jgi:hypothetical protein
VIDQQRVLTGEELLAPPDLLDAGLDPVEVEPIDQFIGDDRTGEGRVIKNNGRMLS